MELLGHHGELVDYLYQRLSDINAGDRSHPNVVILRGPTGTGKTRIVRELFNRLRSSHLDSYWPEFTDTDHRTTDHGAGVDPMSSRKEITPAVEGPGAFTWPANTLPTFSWWGLNCERRERGGTYDVVTAMRPQLSAHMPAYLLAYGRQAGLGRQFTDNIVTIVREVRDASIDEGIDTVLTKLEEYGVLGSIPFIGTLTNWGIKGFQQVKKTLDKK